MAQPTGQALLATAHNTEYFYYAQGSGLFDARNNAMLVKTGSAGVSSEGGANVVLGDGATTYALPSLLNIAAPWTLTVRARIGSSAGTSAMVCGESSTTLNFLWLRQDTNTVTLRVNDESGGSVLVASAVTAMATWTFTFNGATIKGYKNGVEIASHADASAPLKLDTILGGYLGGSFKAIGALEFVHVMPFAATAGEVATLYADPYSVLDAVPTASATFAATTDSPTFSLAANVAGAPTTATFAVTAADSVFSGGAVVATSGSLVSDVLINNAGTVLASQAVYWSWLPLGRIGSLSSVTDVDGTGTTNAGGVLTVTGLSPGAGILLIAKRNTAATDDAVYYQAGTVT